MSYMFVLGPCYACGRQFTFNAERVPSILVDGIREPVCQDCIDLANRRRATSGLPPLVPLPGAYEPEEVS